MLPEIEAIWTQRKDAFRQHRTWKRARRLGLGQLACLGDTWSPASSVQVDAAPTIPIPKRQRPNATDLVSTRKLLQKLTSEMWAYAMERFNGDSGGFVIDPARNTKSQGSEFPLDLAAILARAG